MASGVVNLNSNNSKLEGRVVWSSTSNGSSANSSKVTASTQVRRTDKYTTTGTWSGDANINYVPESYSVHTSVSSNWVTMKTITKTIQHDDNGTKNCWISGYCNAPTGTALEGTVISGGYEVALDTIPRYASVSHSVNSTGLNFARINWSSDNTCDLVQYSVNGGNWVNTSGNPYTIAGLSPNVTYKIRTRVRRKDSGLYSNTGELNVSTKDIARISSASNFNHGDSTVVKITNPNGGTIKLRLVVGNVTIFNRSVSNGNNSISFSDTELDSIYKNYGSSSSVNATFVVDTYNGSSVGWTNTKGVVIYLKGNQKTVKENINGSYRRGKVWINVNGSWKRAVLWINVNGSWKRGI